MFSKKLLKRLPLEKVAIVLTAVALIALSMWLGGRTIESGNISGAFEQLQRTDEKGNLVAELGFVQNPTISPGKEYIQGSRNNMVVNFTLGRLAQKFEVNILDIRGKLVKNIYKESPVPAGNYQTFPWNGVGDYRDGEIYRNGDVPVGDYFIAFSDINPVNTTYHPFKVVPSNNAQPIAESVAMIPFDAALNADDNQSLGFFIRLNRPANITMDLLNDNGTYITRLLNPTYRTAEFYNVPLLTWKGRISGDQVNDNGIFERAPAGTYKFRITLVDAANSSISQSTTYPVTVRRNASGGDTRLVNGITLNPSNRSINADLNEVLTYMISLSRPANVSLDLLTNDGAFLTQVMPPVYRAAGNHDFSAWKGRISGHQFNDNASFQRAPAGTYKIKINAIDASNTNIVASSIYSVTVIRSGSASSSQIRVVSLSKYPEALDLRGSANSIRFSYTLSGVPSSMNASVIDTNGNRVVANLVPVGTCNSFVASQNAICTYYADWNGADRNINAPAYAGNYKFRIEAASAVSGSENSEIAFQVYSSNLGYNGNTGNGGYNVYDPNWNNGGYNNGYNPQARCGTIVDVSASDPLCPAIQFAMSRKFIGGYLDGTVRLKDTIKRGEFLAVVASAFKYNLETYSPYTDGTLGFSDLYGKQGEWYMKYLKTFYRTGVMSGYPDRTMKPEKIMTTAELYVSLFKAAVMSPNRAARFPMIAPTSMAPFTDTPVEPSTDWYMYHAQFAKQFGLVTGSKFNPGKGITRGQVVKLIYDMYQKGLLAL